MNTKKWIFIGLGAVVLTTGVIVTVKIVKKRKRIAEEKKLQEQKENELSGILQQSQSGQSQSAGQSDRVIPQRDAFTKSITNAFSDIKGKKLYPAKKTTDPTQGHPLALGYANLRETPEVNTESAWYDPFDNLIKKYSAGEEIGTIISEQYDDMNPKNRWFKVKMSKPCCGVFSDYTVGWVRSDNVVFRPFTKGKSSFDGRMIKKYDTSYPLGADVFPHSNWMQPNGYPPVHESYDIEDVLEGL